LAQFARYASVPVINALTDLEHPCQVLSDLLTIRERLGALAGRTVAFVGPARHVANSLALAAGPSGLRVRIASPPGYELGDAILAAARARGGAVELVADPRAAVSDADVIYTDVWPAEDQIHYQQARAALAPYQVNASLVASAPERAIVMHEMPAHRGDEITADVIEGSRSVVFDQAENRLHMAKAILRSVLAPAR
jgi:ornithine carbamoyltransferase